MNEKNGPTDHETDDVEAHGPRGNVSPQENDDVEGHGPRDRAAEETGDDDVEGHAVGRPHPDPR